MFALFKHGSVEISVSTMLQGPLKDNILVTKVEDRSFRKVIINIVSSQIGIVNDSRHDTHHVKSKNLGLIIVLAKQICRFEIICG